MLVSWLKAKKKNSIGSGTNLPAEAPLSDVCSLPSTCPGQPSGVGAPPLDVLLQCHNQVSQPSTGTRWQGLCSWARAWHLGVSFHRRRTAGWSSGFPGLTINVGIVQMVVESHRSSMGATVEEHNRPWHVDKINLKIPFWGCFYLKVSFLPGVFSEFLRMLEVAGTIPCSCSLLQRCSWLWTSKQFFKESLGYKKHAKQTVF